MTSRTQSSRGVMKSTFTTVLSLHGRSRPGRGLDRRGPWVRRAPRPQRPGGVPFVGAAGTVVGLEGLVKAAQILNHPDPIVATNTMLASATGALAPRSHARP